MRGYAEAICGQILFARMESKRLAYLAEDHKAALAEDRIFNQARAEQHAAERRREYTAYLCSMADHDCACLALGFDDWARVTRLAVRS
jgi:hypothetical protein